MQVFGIEPSWRIYSLASGKLLGADLGLVFPQSAGFPQSGIGKTLKGRLTLFEKLLYFQAVWLVLRVRGRSSFNRALSGLGVRPVTNTG